MTKIADPSFCNINSQNKSSRNIGLESFQSFLDDSACGTFNKKHLENGSNEWVIKNKIPMIKLGYKSSKAFFRRVKNTPFSDLINNNRKNSEKIRQVIREVLGKGKVIIKTFLKRHLHTKNISPKYNLLW